MSILSNFLISSKLSFFPILVNFVQFCQFSVQLSSQFDSFQNCPVMPSFLRQFCPILVNLGHIFNFVHFVQIVNFLSNFSQFSQYFQFCPICPNCQFYSNFSQFCPFLVQFCPILVNFVHFVSIAHFFILFNLDNFLRKKFKLNF